MKARIWSRPWHDGQVRRWEWHWEVRTGRSIFHSREATWGHALFRVRLFVDELGGWSR